MTLDKELLNNLISIVKISKIINPLINSPINQNDFHKGIFPYQKFIIKLFMKTKYLIILFIF